MKGPDSREKQATGKERFPVALSIFVLTVDATACHLMTWFDKAS